MCVLCTSLHKGREALMPGEDAEKWVSGGSMKNPGVTGTTGVFVKRGRSQPDQMS